MTDLGTDPDEPILTIRPSQGRRWAGILGLAALGLLLIWVAAAGRPALIWQAFYVAAGLGALWVGLRMYRATQDGLVLTAREIRTVSGRVLTPVENVRVVERGAFAFKPSQGFLIRLKEPAGRGWAPGLYWQRGRLLGVGGVLNGGHTRAMAELIASLLYERDD